MADKKLTALSDLENMVMEIVKPEPITTQEALELLNGKVRLQVPDVEPEE